LATVRGEVPRTRAIAALEAPDAISRSTAVSARVSPTVLARVSARGDQEKRRID
jgi:hypothetical protein